MSAPAVVRNRLNVRFHPLATQAAGLVVHGSVVRVESWDLTGTTPVPTVLGDPLPGHGCQATPLGDGRRVLVTQHRSSRHLVALAGGGQVLVGPPECRGLRLVPGRRTAVTALVLAHLHPGRTRITALDANLTARPVAEIAGTVGGGLWLDDRLLAVVHKVGDQARTRVLDTVDGDLRALAGLHPAHRLVLVNPAAGRVLLLVASEDGPQFAVCTPATLDAPLTLTGLRSVPGALHPLAFDPSGRYLMVRADRGAHAVLVRYDLTDHTATEIPGHEGTIGNAAAWTTRALYLTVSTPDLPATMATVTGDGPLCLVGNGPLCSPGDRPLCSAARRPLCSYACSPLCSAPDRSGRNGAVLAHRQRLTGAAGDLEAVVYHRGGQWRDAPRLVLALHGGPEDAWRLGYHPFLRQLADAGLGVVALNQRGSVGYGAAHRDAIIGGWGVADLADVLHCAAELTRYRRAAGLTPPALYGVSYGAFLAMLAVAVSPELFDRVAVVAAFLSAARLAEQASPPVLALLRRHRATAEVTDEFGPRDVARLLGSSSRPLPAVLLVHAVHDEVVPVAQSRSLYRLLRARGAEVSYQEFPMAGHDLATDHDEVGTVLRDMLAGGPLPDRPIWTEGVGWRPARRPLDVGHPPSAA